MPTRRHLNHFTLQSTARAMLDAGTDNIDFFLMLARQMACFEIARKDGFEAFFSHQLDRLACAFKRPRTSLGVRQISNARHAFHTVEAEVRRLDRRYELDFLAAIAPWMGTETLFGLLAPTVNLELPTFADGEEQQLQFLYGVYLHFPSDGITGQEIEATRDWGGRFMSMHEVVSLLIQMPWLADCYDILAGDWHAAHVVLGADRIDTQHGVIVFSGANRVLNIRRIDKAERLAQICVPVVYLP